MNRYKITVILCSIGIALCLITMTLSTYAYFTVDIRGEGEDIDVRTFNDDATIVFTDTSNVSMVNGYTGDSIIKKFTIENTSDYVLHYDIILKNVINNFSNPEELVYTLYSTDGGYRNTSMVPTDDSVIASNILVKPGKKHEYTFQVTFLDTNTNQNDNMNKTFSSNIDIIPSNINIGDELFESGTIGYAFKKDLIGSFAELDNSKDGVYYTNSSDDGNIVYFYRGSKSLNNNVRILNNCYKILRTSENNSVKLVYNGKFIDDKCVIELEQSAFNKNSNYNAYVGFMFGDVSSKNYNSEHQNTRYSEIKSKLDDWYKDNVLIYKSFLNNEAIFCNNRKPVTLTYNKVSYGKLGYADNNTAYYSLIDRDPTYECFNQNDRFSVSNEKSNKSLNYPIGLLTTDELYFAGIEKNQDNKDNFLHIDSNYWTMSPAYYNGSGASVFMINLNGRIYDAVVTREFGIRPVIAINMNTKVFSGDGSEEDPYVLQ